MKVIKSIDSFVVSIGPWTLEGQSIIVYVFELIQESLTVSKISDLYLIRQLI